MNTLYQDGQEVISQENCSRVRVAPEAWRYCGKCCNKQARNKSNIIDKIWHSVKKRLLVHDVRKKHTRMVKTVDRKKEIAATSRRPDIVIWFSSGRVVILLELKYRRRTE